MNVRALMIMAAIPGPLPRGNSTRRDLTYLPYSRACWEWWCRRQGVEFLLLDHPVVGTLGSAPPPVQRWQAAQELLASGNYDVVVVVDADTMVRWDTPNFLDMVGEEFAAVHAGTEYWLQRSIDAYQGFFPDVSLDWRRCFNSGLVVLNCRHLPLLNDIVKFFAANQAPLAALQSRLDVGVDQTVLNFLVVKLGTPLRLLDPAFNMMRCCVLPPKMRERYERDDVAPELPGLSEELAGNPEIFRFVDRAYVWHFTSTVVTRAAAMRETWRRIAHHYPGGE